MISNIHSAINIAVLYRFQRGVQVASKQKRDSLLAVPFALRHDPKAQRLQLLRPVGQGQLGDRSELGEPVVSFI